MINMTLPDKEEDYVHRVGRVGRAETLGLAVSLVATKHKEKVWYYDKRKVKEATRSPLVQPAHGGLLPPRSLPNGWTTAQDRSRAHPSHACARRFAQWEGKQKSTKLASEGGCCIWYDEPALLRGVQARLGTTIETLDAFLERQPAGLASLAAYGQAKEGGLNEASTAHLVELAPAVAELAALETQAQLSFLLGGGPLAALRSPASPAAEAAAEAAAAVAAAEKATSAKKRPFETGAAGAVPMEADQTSVGAAASASNASGADAAPASGSPGKGKGDGKGSKGAGGGKGRGGGRRHHGGRR